jgi:hypothetical protein
VTPRSRALALGARPRLAADLPAKFGCLVDGGGRCRSRASARYRAVRDRGGVAVRVDGEWLGVTRPSRASRRARRPAVAVDDDGDAGARSGALGRSAA